MPEGGKMSNIVKIKSRLTGGAGAGAPAALGEGQLAYNEDGHMAGDTEADGCVNALFVGGKTDATKVLISNRRQVEMTGKQNKIVGRKSFRTLAFGGTIGDGSDDIQFPATRGTIGQILKMNSALNALEWGIVAGITTVQFNITDSGAATLADAINVMDFTAQGGSPTHSISNTELLVLSYKDSAYLWAGPSGVSIGVGGTHTSTASDTTALGSSISFANDADVKAGVSVASAVAPDTLKANYLRTTKDGTADVPQIINNTIAMNAILTMGANVAMAANSISGTDDASRFSANFAELKVADALKLTGALAGVIKGDGVTANQIDGCVLDAGTF